MVGGTFDVWENPLCLFLITPNHCSCHKFTHFRLLLLVCTGPACKSITDLFYNNTKINKFAGKMSELAPAPMTMHYWPIKARSYGAMAVGQAGGLHIVHTQDPNLPSLKEHLPFGQLPYLVDGEVKVAQSLAILRYLARKGGLQGDDDKGFAFSEMLIQEVSNDRRMQYEREN
jgi:hypothetical protein